MIVSILDDNNWSVFGSFIQCNTYFFQSRLCYQSSWLMMIRLHEFQFGCCCCRYALEESQHSGGHRGGRQRIALARRLMSVPRWVSTPPLHVPLSQALAATHNMWIILTSQEPLNGLFRTSHHHLPATDPKFMAEKQLNFQTRQGQQPARENE